jgi:hypothetical protein
MRRRSVLSSLLLALSGVLALSVFTLIQAQPIPLPLDAAQSRATTEFLTNTSFEGDSNGDKLPDGWDGSKTGDPSADKQKCNKEGKVFAHTGDCAFMFKANPDGGKSKLKQEIANFSSIVNDSELTFSAYVDQRSGVPDSKFANAKLKLSDDSKLKLELRLPASATTGYTLVTVSETVVLPASVSITGVSVEFRYGETTGKYLVDDASFALITEDVPTPTPTSPPFITTQLLPNDGASEDFFGYSVSISADGETALVGANIKDNGANNAQGAAYVYVRSGNTWAQQTKLVASDGAATDAFGGSVSLSADGNTALIGATSDTVGTNDNQGSAYIFVRTGSTWTQQQQLLSSDGATSDNFGLSVSLSADGNTALVGAGGDDVAGSLDQGSAYFFVRNGTTWTQQQQITANDGTASDTFGYAVSISGDGKTALVGAIGEDPEDVTERGAAYIFTLGGSVWTQQSKLLANDGKLNSMFGSATSLTADGNTAVVGSYQHIVGSNTQQGAAYVFTRTSTTWTQQQELLASDGATGDRFGWALDISADGSTIGVGAFGDTIVSNLEQGSAYVFKQIGSTWTQQQELLASDGAQGDNFGSGIGLNSDGSAIVIGAYHDTVGTNVYQGSAWVFPIP